MVKPTNLYGPGDNYDPKNSHVLPALIRRMHEAKDQSRFTIHDLQITVKRCIYPAKAIQ